MNDAAHVERLERLYRSARKDSILDQYKLYCEEMMQAGSQIMHLYEFSLQYDTETERILENQRHDPSPLGSP